VSQLALFEAPSRTGGMPHGVRDRQELAFSPKVKGELVARLNERPGQWLGWNDFADIRERYQIGFCMGHVLGSLVREDRALDMQVYFGAERPGMPKPYLGFKTLWGSVLCGPAPELITRKKTCLK
jgi:hypothetical protein